MNISADFFVASVLASAVVVDFLLSMASAANDKAAVAVAFLAGFSLLA